MIGLILGILLLALSIHKTTGHGLLQTITVTMFYTVLGLAERTRLAETEIPLLLETEGITKALNAYPNAHFIYCSTKVVDNWTNDWRDLLQEVR